MAINKYRGIFGVVLLLHVALGVVVITQPGCQSTQSSDTGNVSPVIGPMSEEELAQIETQEVAPISDSIEGDDLFKPLDASFNSGSPAPVFVDGRSAAPATQSISSSRTAPTRPSADAASEPVELLDFSLQPAPIPSSSEPSTMTLVSETPIDESYTVEPGDSLWAISKKYGVSVSSIRSNNGLTSDTLKIGQEILIPGVSNEISVAAPPREMSMPSVSRDIEGREYIVMPRDTLSGIASKTGVSVASIRSANSLSGDLIKVGDVLILPRVENSREAPVRASAPRAIQGSVPQASGIYHIVESGENPTIIARRYGITVKELIQKNGNFDPRALRVGQRLLVGDLVGGGEQVVEIDPPQVIPQVPEGFQPIAPQRGDEIAIEVPAENTSEAEFDEDAFLREIQGAPIVSPVPVDQ